MLAGAGDPVQRADAAKEHGVGGGGPGSAASSFNGAQTFHTSLRLIIARDAAQAAKLHILRASTNGNTPLPRERTAFMTDNRRLVEGKL